MRANQTLFNQLTYGRIGLLYVAMLCSQLAAQDSLPSWEDGATKTRITQFVQRISTQGSDGFVAIADRVAVFDNDGTLWCEQPLYTQITFALERVLAMPANDPRRETLPSLAPMLTGNRREFGGKLFNSLVASTHGGEVREFRASVDTWMRTAKHPRFQRPYTELAYQPMLELLAYLRGHDFQVWIVSGGDVEFMRAWAPETYGIPAERIVGSALKATVVEGEGELVIVRSGEFETFNNGAVKPISIRRIIGRRPIMAIGNSDGDLPMLKWVSQGEGPRFAGLIHHTDAAREWRYDRLATMGRLDKALDEAESSIWTVVDMEKDWKVVFAEVKK